MTKIQLGIVDKEGDGYRLQRVGECLDTAGPQIAGTNPSSTILPSPNVVRRFFIAASGTIHVLDLGTVPDAEVKRMTMPPDLMIGELLGYQLGEEASDTTLMLVTALQTTVPSLQPQLWMLEIADTEIVDAWQPLASPMLRKQSRFFDRFDLPRCDNGAQDCLVVNHHRGRTYIDVEHTRGSDRVGFMEFDGVVSDAAYVDGDWTDIAIIIDC